MPRLNRLPRNGVDTRRPGWWDDLKAIQRGLGRINYVMFKKIVRETISVGDDYAIAAWCQFHGDRINYVMSRHPEEQGYALINLACKLSKEKDHGGEER